MPYTPPKLNLSLRPCIQERLYWLTQGNKRETEAEHLPYRIHLPLVNSPASSSEVALLVLALLTFYFSKRTTCSSCSSAPHTHAVPHAPHAAPHAPHVHNAPNATHAPHVPYAPHCFYTVR